MRVRQIMPWTQYQDPNSGKPYWSDGATTTWEDPNMAKEQAPGQYAPQPMSQPQYAPQPQYGAPPPVGIDPASGKVQPRTRP